MTCREFGHIEHSRRYWGEGLHRTETALFRIFDYHSKSCMIVERILLTKRCTFVMVILSELK